MGGRLHGWSSDVNQFAAAGRVGGDDDDVLWTERRPGLTTFRLYAPAPAGGVGRSRLQQWLSKDTSLAWT